MNYENKPRIESLAKAACPNNKKVSVIFRSKENKLSDRPNAFIVTVGKKGYTSVRQSNYWAVDTVNSCKDYNSYEAAIPDGRIKARAIAQAKRAMRDLGTRRALLAVNSLRTSNILDIITVELD